MLGDFCYYHFSSPTHRGHPSETISVAQYSESVDIIPKTLYPCNIFMFMFISMSFRMVIEFKPGCHISALGYADGVGLLTPSAQSLQPLVHISEFFSEEFGVVFNSKKTMCMRIGSNGDPPECVVSFNGSPLTLTRRIKHLGNIITCDLKDSEDITFKKVPLKSIWQY